jgi:ABC-type polar amino acid transport system ATPase subunit
MSDQAAATSDRPLLQISGLYKRYGAVPVLNGVDLSLRRGEVVVVIGPSGGGKSTLLRCINHLVTPDGGVIRLGDDEVTGRRAKLPLIRRRVGFVAQHFNLYPLKTAVENVMEGPVTVLKQSRRTARLAALELLGSVGLPHKADAYPRELSGGQQQRVAIARALAMKPELLLFDEPTSALDPELTGEVLDVMKSLAEDGMTMLIASHEMEFARQVADRIVMIDQGTVIEDSSPEDLFSHPKHERTRQFVSRVSGWRGA